MRKQNNKYGISCFIMSIIIALSVVLFPYRTFVYATESMKSPNIDSQEIEKTSVPTKDKIESKGMKAQLEDIQITESKINDDEAETIESKEQSDNETKQTEPKQQAVNKTSDTASYANNAGSFNVIGGTNGIDWSYVNNVLTFNNSGNYTVIGNGIKTSDKIVVSEDFQGAITIKNVNINADCAFYVNDSSNLTIMLEGENVLTSGNDHAGLEFNYATTDSTVSTGSLTINSTSNGSLTVQGGQGAAGIGGGASKKTRNIIINGGNITATGGGDTDQGGAGKGQNGAGIGGGYNGSGEDITINGGTVIATGGNYGAGIGGGSERHGKGITINGGNITAIGEYGGAGIGGGSMVWVSGGSGEDIIINGGTVTAVANPTSKGNCGAGIGGGFLGSTSNIQINAGSVKAESKTNPLGTVPVNKDGVSLYLAELKDQAGITAISIDGVDYKISKNHTGGDNGFFFYLTGKDHIVKDNNGKRYLAKWNGEDGFTWSTENNYTLIIPETTDIANNGGQSTISVSDINLIDITQKVKVKVSDSTEIDNGGNLALNQINGTAKITTFVSTDRAGNSPLRKGEEVLYVEGNSKEGSKNLYFKSPVSDKGSNPAGSYRGTITFISWVE